MERKDCRMNGICEVPECKEQSFMVWRPLTEKTGQQVCKPHFEKHKESRNEFLYNAFRIKKAQTIATPDEKEYCSCGRQRQQGHKYCPACIAKRKRQQRKDSYYKNKNAPAAPTEKTITLICGSEDCQSEREPNHRYCSRCAEKRKRESNRKRQRRHYRKITISEMAQHNVSVF